MFADKAKITISSGKGGDGHVSFRREKYVPNGGPDGGDGGDGGSVVFKVDKGASTLSEYRHVRKYAAENGEDGKKKRQSGRKGKDLILSVPEGTVIKEAVSGKVIADMSGDTSEFLILKGGRGGNGNMHYATSTMQAPKYAQPGQPAKTLELILELKVIADAGLVGFPNVGKSTLLSMCSNARPKIADYHFTTLSPVLGVVDLGDMRGFVIADIPGLIEGAAEGAGLGHDFLAHIERTRVLIHVVDASGSEGRDPVADITAINNELAGYMTDLSDKPQVIAANKLDLLFDDEAEDVLARIRAAVPEGTAVFPISAATGKGVRELLYHVYDMLSQLPPKEELFPQEYDPEEELQRDSTPFTVSFDADAGEYIVEGPRIERMLGYTNLETEKGFVFFQKFLVENGIIDRLKELGIEEGDTVRLYGHTFEFYDS
ncbi:MAG: GTPase ObgE [Lachnospiraceae bacterium]|nr:GTPase ObgE [Lachnospiraceae bacterium]